MVRKPETQTEQPRRAGRTPLPESERLIKVSITISADDLRYVEGLQEDTGDGRKTGVPRAMRRVIREHRESRQRQSKKS